MMARALALLLLMLASGCTNGAAPPLLTSDASATADLGAADDNDGGTNARALAVAVGGIGADHP